MVLVSTLRNAFHKYHLLFNSITYGSLYVAGDITQQKLRKVEKMNWANTLNIGLVTGGIFGPVLHYWYIWLDKFLPGNTKNIVLRKMVMDQALSIPLIFIFFTGIRMLERKPHVFKEAVEKTPKTWLTACCFWPPIQAVNFFILPTKLRTVYVGCAAYVWSIILCFFKAATPEQIHVPKPHMPHLHHSNDKK